MLETLISDIEFGDIHQIVVQEWLRSKELFFTGDISERLRQHYSENKITTESITAFMEGVKIGGSKNILVLSLSADDWENINLRNIERNALTRIQALDPESSIYSSDLTTNSLKIIIKKDISFYRVRGGRYTPNNLNNIDGNYYCQTHLVEKELFCVLDLNLGKKRITFWFDSFNDLGNEWSKKTRASAAHMMVNSIIGNNNSSHTQIGRNFPRLLTSDVCKLDKIQKTHRGKNRNDKQTNLTYTMASHNTEGDPRELDDPVAQAILAAEDPTKVSFDHLRLKWLKDKSGNRLLRDVTTTIFKKGFIDFHSFSTKEDIEYVLSRI